MTKYKFTGDYSNGATKVDAWGITFYARNGSDVPAELVDKFERHIEFEKVTVRKAKKADEEE